MRCYLSTPGSQAQAHVLAGRNVLISYAYQAPWLINLAHTFGRVMWDCGAYTAYTKGVEISLDAYAETARSIPWADSAASLDSIAGDWKAGLANWDRYPWMFPVYHDSDPPEALDAIVERLSDPQRGRFREQTPQWIGLGMVPPRRNRRWLAETLPRIPAGVHVHGFAMRAHADVLLDHRGADCSADSVNWMMDANQLLPTFPWLTATERVELVAKRYEREHKFQKREAAASQQQDLFGDASK